MAEVIEKYEVDKADLVSVADTIRAKGNTGSELVFPQGFKDAVDAIKTSGDVVLQSKTVIPTKQQQIIKPDAGSDALSEAIIKPIPDEYIIPAGTKEINSNGIHNVTEFSNVDVDVPIGVIPSGTKSITTNGTHDVSGYANAEVNVATAPKLQSKMAEITANGMVDVVADSGYDGLERVTIFTEVPAPVLTYYDGSVTISGGVELISFTIAGTSYQAESGMTWAEWGANETYNKGDYDVLGDYYVYKSDTRQPVTINADGSGSFVNRTDVIIADHSYGIQPADN